MEFSIISYVFNGIIIVFLGKKSLEVLICNLWKTFNQCYKIRTKLETQASENSLKRGILGVFYSKKVIYIVENLHGILMINTTLLNIIGKFSAKEIREFGEFIISPFFNKNENVIKLYTYIKKFHPELNDKRLEKEYVYRKVFSKGKYNDGFMRTVIYNLGKLTEDFLAYVNFSKNELNKGINLLVELNERKLEKVFLKYYSEIESDLEKQKHHDAGYFYMKYMIKEQMEDYMDWSKFKNKDFKNYTQNTTNYIYDELTCFYIIKALNHYRFMLDKANYEQIDYDYSMLDSLVDYLLTKENKYIEKIKIKLHLYEILIQKEGKDEHYRVLKEILISAEDSLNHSDRYSLHNILQAFCIRKTYEGDTLYKKERFELYKICVEQKLYLASEHIYFDDLMFANIANSAITLKEFTWFENFMNEHKDELSRENKDMVISYSYARLNFENGVFDEALKHLNSIKNIKHIQFKLPIRDLTLMVYYELGLYSQAFYQIDSYRHFLTNNKSFLSGTRYERINGFVKVFTKLVKLKEKTQGSVNAKISAESSKIKSELEENSNIQERNWLIQKANELN